MGASSKRLHHPVVGKILQRGIIFIVLLAVSNGIDAADPEEGNDNDADLSENSTVNSSVEIYQVSYNDIYAAVVFLAAVHYIGVFGEYVKIPALIGQIITGIVLGPQLLDFVPYTNAFVLIGEIALILQMFEAGIEVDLTLIAKSGTRAIVLSLVGAMLAVGSGIGVGFAFGLNFQGAFAIGAVFAQTANGTCLPILRSGGLMTAPVGQMILAATIIDDMIALTLLSVMESFGAEKISVVDVIIPCLSSIGWLALLGAFAGFVAPAFIESIFMSRVQRKHEKAFVLFILMSICAAGYLPLLQYTRASYLIGAFLSGMTFSKVDKAHNLFLEYGKDIMSWLMKLFFSATIGFQIPIKLFGKGTVWYKGLVFTATAVILKAGAALIVPRFQEDNGPFHSLRRDQFVVALSMMCRGGFGFIISSLAFSLELIDSEIYASVVLAALVGTIFPPFLLNYCIRRYGAIQQRALEEEKHSLAKRGMMPLFLMIHMKTKSSWGVLSGAIKEIYALGLSVEDYKSSHNNGKDATVTTDFYLRDNKTEVEAKHTIEGALSAGMFNAKQSMKVQTLTAGENKSQEKSKEIDDIFIDEPKSANLMRSSILGDEVNIRITEINEHLREKLTKKFDLKVLECFIWDPYDVNEILDQIFLTRGDGRAPTKEFFHNFFIYLDEDGSGSIDQNELREGLLAANFKVSDEGFQVLLKKIDSDNDGLITSQEWDFIIDEYLIKKNGLKQKRRYSSVVMPDMSWLEEDLLEVDSSSV